MSNQLLSNLEIDLALKLSKFTSTNDSKIISSILSFEIVDQKINHVKLQNLSNDKWSIQLGISRNNSGYLTSPILTKECLSELSHFEKFIGLEAWAQCLHITSQSTLIISFYK